MDDVTRMSHCMMYIHIYATELYMYMYIIIVGSHTCTYEAVSILIKHSERFFDLLFDVFCVHFTRHQRQKLGEVHRSVT